VVSGNSFEGRNFVGKDKEKYPRVFIDPGNALPTTGTGVYTRSLIDGLNKYGSSRLKIIESDICSSSSSLRPLHRLVYLRRLRKKQLQSFDAPDVFHFTNVYSPKKLRSVGFVTSIHDIDPITFPESHSYQFQFYFKKAVNMSAIRSDVVLTDTEASKQLLIEYLKGYEAKIQVIPIGVSLEFANYIDMAKQNALSNVPVMLYVGSLSKKKNTSWLIRMVSQGVKTGSIPKMKLVLVGSPGFGFNEIEYTLRDAGDLVEWKKGVSCKELASIYKNCDVVVLPSLTEGFGLPLIEAMYCRKPIVASNIPTSNEVASKAAHYFNINDREGFYSAVRSALEDTKRDERLLFINNRIKRYLWQNLAGEYEALYNSVSEKNK
jgi:glycosyltransferase involved in cell wall biosynthesis